MLDYFGLCKKSILLFALIILSCEEDSFMDIDEAKKFSASSLLSAMDARAILKEYLSNRNIDIERYGICVIRKNEYYFLKKWNKSGAMDGFAVHAANGTIRRVRSKKRVIYPYNEQEQKILFRKD